MPVPFVVDKRRLIKGKLLDEAQERQVQAFFHSNPNAVLFTGTPPLPYPVARLKEGRILVLYAEPKHLHYTPDETSKIAFQENAEGALRPLGGGASAVVIAAQDLEGGNWYAAKFQTTLRLDDSSRNEIGREQQVLRKMNLFKGGATIEKVNTRLDANAITLMTVMELASGKKLETLVEEDKRKPSSEKFSLDLRLNLAIDASKRTHELAKKGLVQCDFNPKNLICQITPAEPPAQSPKVEVALIDFGEVYELNGNGEFIAKERIPETPGFGAPEVSQGGFLVAKRSYSENTMAFSLGKTLSTLNTPSDNVAPNMIEKAFYGVTQKLSHEDPNQRISPELATEELSVIKDYHQLLKKSGQLDSFKDSASLLEHMRKSKQGKTDPEWQALERRLIDCQQKQATYQYQLFTKRVESYIARLETNEPNATSHIKEMKRLEKKIKKLEPNHEDFAMKLEALRIKTYEKHAKYEGSKSPTKAKSKETKESSNVLDKSVNWVKNFISPSSSKSDVATSPLSSANISPNLSRSSSTTSNVSSSRSDLSMTSSSSLSFIDNQHAINTPPPPLILSRVKGEAPLPRIASAPTLQPPSPPINGKAKSASPKLVENASPSPGFSPAFKMELERRLANSDSKIGERRDSPEPSPKSTKTKRGISR